MLYIATTQPTTQNKTKQLGWCGIIIGKINHTTTTTTTPPPPHRVPLHLRQFQATYEADFWYASLF
jgi:hypothetical protein